MNLLVDVSNVNLYSLLWLNFYWSKINFVLLNLKFKQIHIEIILRAVEIINKAYILNLEDAMKSRLSIEKTKQTKGIWICKSKRS